MNTPKIKKFTRAKNLDPTKAQEFINGAESDDSVAVEQTNPETEISEPVVKEAKKSSLKEFSSESEETISQKIETPTTQYPWETANERVLKGVNLRLTEVQWAKLRFIVDNTPFSIQKYIMHLLEPAMDESIEKILSGPKQY